MKKSVILVAALVGLVITSCRKIEMDGGTVTVVTPPTTTGQTITLKGRIASDTVLKAGNNYILSGLVYMVNNATMKIEPGVTVKGDFQGANVAGLIITRGAKIVADGAQDNPIVFTSNSPVPRSGDWAGIVILGKAKVNSTFTGTGGGAGTIQVEGGIDNSFGDGIAGGGATPNDDDSSGVLRYVRIEYAGYAFQPDKEINSLTMAAVGRKTVIDYVQVTYAKDDAFEWFGGTVNCKHLIAYKTQDDDFDTDNGFSGTVQFGIAFRDSTIADISRSEAFESDNDPSGSINAPQTSAVFSNMTVIGPRASLANSGNSLYLAGAHIRRNSGISIFNSIFLGWPQGLLVDSRNGRAMELNIQDSTVRFKNNTIVGCGPAAGGTDITSYAFIQSTANVSLWTRDSLVNRMANSFFGNTVLTTIADAKMIAPFNYSAPDFLPFGGSNGYQPILTGAKFTDPKLANATVVTFRGACDAAGVNANWWRGWTRFVNQ
ncbi:MAG: hypothetical protein Q8K64_11775 [Sediminibacterium sp.]|nr:hypothetical protein [Sediminibacterium sp.]TXT33890.1 MAG: hypothetical protein FD136_626 [Chitinophagaceae bacterium]